MTTGSPPLPSLDLGAAGLEALFRRRRDALDRGVGGVQSLEDRALVLARSGERYLLALEALAEAQPSDPPLPVPGWPAELLGIVNRRGTVRAVADLGRLLGLPPAAAASRGHVLFLRPPLPAVGLWVDGVGDIIGLDPARFQMPGGNAPRSPAVRGVDGEGLILIEPAQLGLERLASGDGLSRAGPGDPP